MKLSTSSNIVFDRPEGPFFHMDRMMRYAKEAGKLMLFLAAGSLIMTVLLYFQVIAAVAQIVVWIIVFGILWKKMDERYGA